VNAIDRSTQRYHNEWPDRRWRPRGPAQVRPSDKKNHYEVLQPFTWYVSDGTQEARGIATLYLQIRRNTRGEFEIVKVRQREP
jgi:hypothetical protein